MAVLVVTAALAAATAGAAEPPSPAALRDLAPTGSLRVTFIVSNPVHVVKAGLAYVAAFVSEAKASGLVGQSIARAGLSGVTVAP